MSFFTLFTKKKPDPPIQSPLDRKRSDEAPLKQKICVCNPTKINQSSYKTLSKIDSKPDGSLICSNESEGNSGIKVCLPSFASDYQIDTSTTVALTIYTTIYGGDTSKKEKMSFEDIMGEIEMLHEFKDITPELKGVFFITDPIIPRTSADETSADETNRHETSTFITSAHKTYGISNDKGVINNNIFIAGENIIDMREEIGEIKDKIQIVVLLMEKGETNYDIKNANDAKQIVELIDTIIGKGKICIDFKYDNTCRRIGRDKKILLIDTDKVMFLDITEEQKIIAKKYMILLFITDMYDAIYFYTQKKDTENLIHFKLIIQQMVELYKTIKLPETNDLLNGIETISWKIPTRTPMSILINYMVLPNDIQTSPDITPSELLILHVKHHYVLKNADNVSYTGNINREEKEHIDIPTFQVVYAANECIEKMFKEIEKITKKGGKTRRKRNKSKSKRKTKTKR